MTRSRFSYLLHRLQMFRRSIHKIIRNLRGQTYRVSKIHGSFFLLDNRNTVDRNLDVFRSYEAKQLSKLIALIKQYQCTTFLDIGAHGGFYSIILSNEKTIAPLNVVAFEPDRINLYQLYANLFLNYLDQVTVHGCGLSNQNGKVSFTRFDPHNRGRSHISEQGDQTVEIRRGDDLLSFNQQRLALKIDVEGHEQKVLEGMPQLLENNQCVLQVECLDEQASVGVLNLLGQNYRSLGSINSDYYFTNIPETS